MTTLATLNRNIRFALQGLRREEMWLDNLVEINANMNDEFGALKLSLQTCKDVFKGVSDLVKSFVQPLEKDDETALDEELNKVSSLYQAVARRLQKVIESIESEERLNTASVVNESNPHRESHGHSSQAFNIPKIQIPKFDGKPENWITFRDMFDALIHKHETMNKIVKFQHLREAVKLAAGESNVLDQHSISEAGYDDAWKALNDRYDDKRKIFSSLLQKMFTCKTMANGSAEEIRRILDTFSSAIKALSLWEYPLEDENDLANLLVVHMVTFRFDDETRREWNKFNKCDTATWKELSDFLVVQWRSLDDYRPARKSRDNDTRIKSRVHVTNSDAMTKKKMELSCYLCNEAHGLWSCSKFINWNVDQRQDYVKKSGLCLNCLSKGHRVAECSSKFKCSQCSRAHHTLLHFSSPRKTEFSVNVPSFTPQQLSRAMNVNEVEECAGASNVAKAFVVNSQYLMSTVALNVFDKNGKVHVLRALLDNGSDTNFITSRAASWLGLPHTSCCKAIVGISGETTISRFKFNATISSRYTDFNQKLEFFVLDKITGILPSCNVNKKMISIPAGTQLADPMFHKASEVDMLLNGNVYNSSSMDMTSKLSSGQYLKRSQFGWVVNGSAPTMNHHASTYLSSCFTLTSKHVPKSVEANLDEKLEKFFMAEDMTTTTHPMTAEEKYCEVLYENTTTRGKDGRYIVQMPVKDDWWKLQRNEGNAHNQLRAVEARRMKDEKFDELYREYMDGLIRDGLMTKVERRSSTFVHYLPHHGVLKESSTSTKLRPVFNGSSNTGQVSLNDVLCTGPTVQPEAFDILLRFREKKYVLTADITKMYLQIWIHPTQRKFLRLLWRSDMQETLEAYEMNVVTFGTKPAPFLATRTLNKIAQDNEESFPEAAEVLRNAFYVDDLTKSFDSIEEAMKIRDHLRVMLSSAGMKLCKFSSNCEEIVKDLSEDVVDNKPSNDKGISKTLGIGYDNVTDEFSYNFEIKNESVSTKTSVLSQIASLYDPNGWVGPVVIKGKLIMKKLWMKNLKWKEQLSQEDQEEWDEFRQSLPLLNQIRIERHCLIDNHVRVELHGFADASIQAYGIVLYLVSYDRAENVKTAILCAKSRVAPKKQKTLARLELLAATLLAIVVNRLSSILDCKLDKITLWSDSTIVLSWITLDTSRLNTFVANRVAVIQEVTHEMEWKHIRGTDNPADVVSRGLSSEEMESCSLWWKGPTFFAQPQSEWPESIFVINKDLHLEVDESDPELKVEMKRTLIVQQPDDLFTFVETRFSSTRKTIGTLAYVRRFINNVRKTEANRTTGELLTVEELEEGERLAYRIVQRAMFTQEQKALKKFNDVHEDEKEKAQSALFSSLRSSNIFQLSPFLHEDGLLRVKGRVCNSDQLDFDQKHQIILPHCSFTNLLLRDLHKKHLHVGAQSLVAISRQKFWIIRAKASARKVVNSCVRCFKVKPKEFTQFMGNLPAARVNQAPVFSKVAVDYTGFFNVRTSLARNTSKTKAYVCIFKCMCSGAMHLELVLDLSAKGFIEALDRFVSRRGLCSDIFSDNGTNFEGANNELRQIVDEQNAEVEQICREKKIGWHFTTPRAPHAGGIYESGVKSMKYHLKRIMDDNALYNVQQFETILCKIEAILNSRPLTALSDDPNDFDYLSPAHFLVGRPLLAPPQRDHIQTPMNRLERWEMVQQVQQRFWKLWYQDYLHQLQLRPKGFREKTEISEGTVVLLKDSNLPPMKWLIGRIVRVFLDKNKVAHNVVVMTKNGEKTRNVKYLCPLPIEK